jgi:hypothetical protein
MGLFEYGFDWVFESVKGWLFVIGEKRKETPTYAVFPHPSIPC